MLGEEYRLDRSEDTRVKLAALWNELHAASMLRPLFPSENEAGVATRNGNGQEVPVGHLAAG